MFVEDKLLVKCYYLSALQISRCKKPYTIKEYLIKTCLLIDCKEVLGKQAVQKLKNNSMSSSTVQRRIKDMAGDIKNQVIALVKNSPFYSIQLDEITDIS